MALGTLSPWLDLLFGPTNAATTLKEMGGALALHPTVDGHGRRGLREEVCGGSRVLGACILVIWSDK